MSGNFVSLIGIEFKSIFRNRHNIGWAIGYIVIWVLIINFTSTAPPPSYKVEYLQSYVSFIVMLAAASLFVTVAYRVANDVIPHIYLYKNTETRLSTLLLSIILSTFIFTLIVVIISYLIAYIIFGISYGTFPAVNALYIVLAIFILSFFYVSFGSFFAYLLLYFKSIKLVRYSFVIPMIFVFGLVLGLQVNRTLTTTLIYSSPFNSLYSAFEIGTGGYFSYSFGGISINSTYLFLFSFIWAIGLLLISYLLFRAYSASSAKNQLKPEDIYS